MTVPPFRGARVRRIEDPTLLLGRGRYVDDLIPEDVWHVAVVRSPHPHARIRRIDARQRAEVVTARDLDEAIHLPGEFSGAAVVPHPLLAGDRACYLGQPVVAVIARTLPEALDAADAVEVEYDPLPPVLHADQALGSGVHVHPHLGSNVAYAERWRRGAPARAFAHADVTVAQRIRHQRLVAMSLEGRAVLAVPPRGGEGTLTVWSSTQMPHALRDELEARLPLGGVPVRVIAPDVGGGFGAKINIYPEELLIPLLALRLGRPLKWVESRREHVAATSHGRSQYADVRLAASRAGQVLAWQVHIVADVGAYLLSTTAEVPTLTLEMATGAYDIKHVDAKLVEVYTNKVPTGAYRGAGRPEAAFYLERAMDILADELQIDPAELRRRNFIPPDRFPYRAPSGATYDSGTYAAALDLALEAAAYAEWRARQERARKNDRYLGIGLSSYVESCTFGTDASRVALAADGTVTAYTGTSPHGQGGATGFAQIIADALGIDVRQVHVVHGDTAFIPEGEGTAGSRTLVVGGSALYRAALALRAKLLKRASRRLEARVEDLALAGGRVYVAGVPSRGLSLGALVGDRRGGLSAAGRFTVRGATFPFGTHVSVVEIDADTGAVHILHHVAVDDCGVVVNPLLVEGQIHGGVVQAIGQALSEEVQYDPGGQLLSGSLLDYALPRAHQVPTIATLRSETPSPRNPLGAKGVGEAGTIGATPAVVNAVLDALAPFGVRHLDMPLTAGKIWAAIQQVRR